MGIDQESNADSMTRGISRRSVIKGALGASIASLGGSLSPLGSAWAADHPLKGQSIDMSILGIAGWTPSSLGVKMSPLFAQYAKDKYGYDVSFRFASAPFSALFQKAGTSLVTRSQEFNIIISDSQWLGAFAQPGWILKLNPVIKRHPELDVKWYSDTIRRAYQVYPDGSNGIWGLPQEADTIVLYVRKDRLTDPKEKAAFKHQYGKELPESFADFEALTMSEFEHVAAFFTRPHENFYGTSMQYSREYDYCTCFLYPFMWSQGGKVWDQKTGQVEGLLNSKINATAMEQMKHWLKYMPPGAVNYGISQEIDAFTQGKVFSCFQWSAVGPAMIPDHLKGKVIVVPPPKHGTGSQADRVYTIGGQPWVINRFNDKARMRVAIDFLKWWYQPKTQQTYAHRGGNPSDAATLNKPGFNDIQPWFRAYKYMLLHGRSRDFWHDPQYSRMLSIQQDAFTSYMTGQTDDPMKALTYAACKQQKILYAEGVAKKAPSGQCSSISL